MIVNTIPRTCGDCYFLKEAFVNNDDIRTITEYGSKIWNKED